MLNAQKGAPFYGDARKSGQNNFATMAQSFWGGYWLINSAGKVFVYGSGCLFGTAIGPSKIVGPIVGTIGFGKNESGSGFYEVNSAGTLYSSLACEALERVMPRRASAVKVFLFSVLAGSSQPEQDLGERPGRFETLH